MSVDIDYRGIFLKTGRFDIIDLPVIVSSVHCDICHHKTDAITIKLMIICTNVVEMSTGVVNKLSIKILNMVRFPVGKIHRFGSPSKQLFSKLVNW